MSERGGVFAVARGIWDHEVFAPEPFTEREAWLWLISEAAWKTRTKRVGKWVGEIDRGQVATSERFCAKAWGWKKTRVRRFFDTLKTHHMADHVADQHKTIITICNYNEYQKVGLPEKTTEQTKKETTNGPQADQTRNIETLNKTYKGEIPFRVEVCNAMQLDPDEPEAQGLHHQIQHWMAIGATKDLILAVVAQCKERGKTHPNYLTACIRTALQDAQAPPQVRVIPGGKSKIDQVWEKFSDDWLTKQANS